MSARGKLNSRGLQFLRGASLFRPYGNDVTGPPIDITAGTRYICGFSSGVPAAVGPTTGTATSGFTIPATGTYHAKAVVYASGISFGKDVGDTPPEYGIALTLDGNDIWQSVRTLPGASGTRDGIYQGITRLETEAIFEANAQQTLAVSCVSNSSLGTWRLAGADSIAPNRSHPISQPAAVLMVQRMPTLPLDSNVFLQ